MTDNIPDVLWVNYDAQHMKTRPHRQRIFRHIQTKYRPHEKQERARALRTSAKIPEDFRQQKQYFYGASSRKETIATTATYEESSTEDGQGTQQPSLLFEEGACSPSTVLRRGNSDPFNALAVPINAEDNRIVSFYRDFLLPAEYNVDDLLSKDVLANVRAKADWELHVSGLHDEGTALAFIASNASLVALTTNSTALHRKSMTMRVASMASLRQKLTTTPKCNPLLWWHIDMIWTAEVAAGNAIAARVHGDMLGTLLKEFLETGGTLFDAAENMKGRTVLELMLFFMWVDSDMATRFLIRPSFDPYAWLPGIFAPFLERVEPLLLPEPVRTHPLDLIIDSEDLVWCFDKCAETVTTWRERKTLRLSEMEASINMCQGLYIFAISLGRLVSRYCTFNELCASVPDPSHYQYAQQYLTLAAIRWSRAEVQNDAYGKNLWVGKVMKALRSVLESSGCSVGSEAWETWKNARLWTFYVGAIYEVRKYPSSEDWQRGWFNEQIRRQAQAMALTDWADVTEILSGFLFDYTAYETERRWFEKAINVGSVRKGGEREEKKAIGDGADV